MKAVADTSPLVAAANYRDRAHALASSMVAGLGRDLVVLGPVMVETDYLLRRRIGAHAARAFLSSLVTGEHSTDFLTPGLLRRATEIDARHASLDLGLTDASLMAYAERHDFPILTFDFEHFRAVSPARGQWRLIVDEAGYAEATS